MLYSLRITALSAVSTLRICTRQSVKDTRKVYRAVVFIAQLMTSNAVLSRLNILKAIALDIFTILRLFLAFLVTFTHEKLEAFEASCQVMPGQLTTPDPTPEPDLTDLLTIQPAPNPLVLPTNRETLKTLAHLYEVPNYSKLNTKRLIKAVARAVTSYQAENYRYPSRIAS